MTDAQKDRLEPSADGSEVDPCFGCTEGDGWNDRCSASRRACRHHCNCQAIHDCCHWCGTEWGEEGVTTGPDFERSRLIKEPNPFTDKPTGMCGSSKVCARCPSHFICSIKAGDEMKRINAERAEASDGS